MRRAPLLAVLGILVLASSQPAGAQVEWNMTCAFDSAADRWECSLRPDQVQGSWYECTASGSDAICSSRNVLGQLGGWLFLLEPGEHSAETVVCALVGNTPMLCASGWGPNPLPDATICVEYDEWDVACVAHNP